MGVDIVREEVEIHTADGISLRATVCEPRGAAPKAVCVFAHAMFARRTQFDKPTKQEGWLETFASAGVRAIAFDFRGHGDSGKPASQGGFWSYDDLVLRDLPAVVGAARDRAGDAPVIVAGHSLGGHTSLAAQGIGKLGADALILVAAAPWIPRFDRSLARRALKFATLEALVKTTARVGYFPAKKLGQGSDDEAAPYMHDLARFCRKNVWCSEDDRYDYFAGLANVDIPIASFASRADRIQCVPECAEALLATVKGTSVLRVLETGDSGGAAPNHMELVTRSREVRNAALRFALDVKRR